MSGETWRIVVPREVTRVVKIPTGLPGSDGKSAYQLAVSEGFEGTEAEWLASLRGVPGDDGADGLSAYEIARALGFAGTEQEWLDSLVGESGTSAEIVGVSASQLPAGSSPTVSMGGTSSQRTLSFGIPAGAPGSKGDPGDTDAWIIRGAGRPDVPASLSTETAAAVAAATSGAEFVSVDGAGVGAWVWRKHGTSWVVTDGDTGRRAFIPVGLPTSGPGVNSRIYIRRINNDIHMSFGGGQWDGFYWDRTLSPQNNVLASNQIPNGFRMKSSSMLSVYDDNGVQLSPLYVAGVGDSSIIRFKGSTALLPANTSTIIRIPELVGTANDPWPITLGGSSS